MHPLTPNLTELKDDELLAKLQELNTKLNQAYKFRNAAMIGQIQMLLEDYQTEINLRRQSQLDNTKDKNNLSSLIKVR